MMRYIRAFFTALKLTLSGEAPATLAYQPLIDWLETTHQHAETVLEVADENGFDANKRKALTIMADGREQSMETIIKAVAYHTGEEYPYMLKHMTEHTITAIYASNMNDQYLVLRLAEKVQTDDALAPIYKAIRALQDQLNTIPPSTSLTTPSELRKNKD